MRIVMFSTDVGLCAHESAVAARHRAYGERLTLDIVLVTARGSYHDIALSRTVRVHSAAASSQPLSLLYALVRAMRLDKPDVVSVQDPFEIGFVGMCYALLVRAPLYVQVHTNPMDPHFTHHSWVNVFRVFLMRIVLCAAARVRVVSETVREALKPLLPSNTPSTVLPIYTDTKRFAALSHRAHGKHNPALLFVGRLEPEKQCTLALDALATLHAHGFKDAGLTIAGDGREKEMLKTQAEALGIAQSVVFVGHTEDVASLYQSADVLLVPSQYEGYGLVIVEALAAHVPVVAHEVGVAREAGASIAPAGRFSDAVLAWARGTRVPGVLRIRQYGSFDEYAEAYARDIQSTARIDAQR